MHRIRFGLLLCLPVVLAAGLGGAALRDASRWFEAADELWEPLLDDNR